MKAREASHGRKKAGARSASTKVGETGAASAASNGKATLDHALLGLIAEQPGLSGYDLVKIFNLSMVHFWHAYPTQIYPTLDRMERLGLIKGREVVQRDRPNKRQYTITTAGRQRLVGWLKSPFEEIKLKHPPLLRCRFLGHLEEGVARAKLLEERAAWEHQLDLYRKIEQQYFADQAGYRDVNSMFSMFTLRRGIDWMLENIRWCNWAIAEIDRNHMLFQTPEARAQSKEPPPAAHRGYVSFREWERQESERKGKGKTSRAR
jgi:DNA-binding PadR family transcriptional regulator